MADILIMEHPEKGKTRKLYVGPNWVLVFVPAGIAIIVAQWFMFNAVGGLIGGAALGMIIGATIQGLGIASLVKKNALKLISKGWMVRQAQGDKARALSDEIRSDILASSD